MVHIGINNKANRWDSMVYMYQHVKSAPIYVYNLENLQLLTCII